MSKIIRAAFQEAKIAGSKGEIPIGAVVFKNNEVVSKSGNQVEKNNDPLAHAEIIAMKKASKLLSIKRLHEYDMYVTLEPCIMCGHAISLFRIKRLYFGAYDNSCGSSQKNFRKSNMIKSNDFSTEIYGGIGEDESEEILKKFFRTLRKN